MTGWRALRIGLLLFVLVLVAAQAWLRHDRLIAWDHSLWVAVYAIPGDDSPVTAAYLATLDSARFDEVESFMAREAAGWGLPLAAPVRLEWSGVLAELPPSPPADPAVLGVVWWSLKLRAWAARMEGSVDAAPGEISLFVVYHDPARSPRVPHSLALPEAQLGVVHAFAAERQHRTNAVVIAHEMLHALRATDKYDRATSLPRWPEGYAEPEAEPLHPQAFAELMAGRLALAPDRAEIPASLDQVVVGEATAREIRWLAPEDR